eukprot:1519832-Rhodomonas_salina.1
MYVSTGLCVAPHRQISLFSTKSVVGRRHGTLHFKIKYKKPLFQYNLYQDFGFSDLISGCMSVPDHCKQTAPCGISIPRKTAQYARSVPDMARA